MPTRCIYDMCIVSITSSFIVKNIEIFSSILNIWVGRGTGCKVGETDGVRAYFHMK